MKRIGKEKRGGNKSEMKGNKEYPLHLLTGWRRGLI
jgi:hypothetical protein